MLISGVDEAGRGPVIGPLIIAGVSIEDSDSSKLVGLGVKDSKLLSAKRREMLAIKIKDMAQKWQILSITPAEIDRVVESKRKLHKLNRLEAQAMASVIATLKPDIAYVDASDTIANRFGDHIAEKLSFTLEIVSEHKADRKYPIVSAASILAKVERDKAISQLQKMHGNLGCGYPSDSNTIEYLESCIQKFGVYPDFVRKSWKTAKRIRNEVFSKQKTLI
jgi:ribonuclease HII